MTVGEMLSRMTSRELTEWKIVWSMRAAEAQVRSGPSTGKTML